MIFPFAVSQTAWFPHSLGQHSLLWKLVLTSKLVKDGAPLLSRALWLYAPITMEDPASFVGLSFVSCLTGVPPASGPNLAAGLYHGVVKGTALFLLGAVLAALVSVALTRSFLRGLILSKMAAYEEKRIAIEAAIEKEGALMIVILLRLSPAMPLAPANILLGLTTVGIAPLLVGTAMGLLPFTAVYAYVGSVGQQAAEGGSNRTQLAAQIVGILATVALTLKITRVAQKALDARKQPALRQAAGDLHARRRRRRVGAQVRSILRQCHVRRSFRPSTRKPSAPRCRHRKGLPPRHSLRSRRTTHWHCAVRRRLCPPAERQHDPKPSAEWQVDQRRRRNGKHQISCASRPD